MNDDTKHAKPGAIDVKHGRAPQELSIQSVNKTYDGGVHAVKGISLELAAGEFMVLVGPSGCGKSTMLRMLAGLESVDSGDIRLGGRSIVNVAPKARDIAMVFQNYALYPTMRVYDNLAFPLKMARWSKAAIDARVCEIAAQLGLDALLRRYPGALSGGQRQRVALGRAMVREPALFLMDEPLSNLDAELRVQMRREIVRLQRKLGCTTVYVTHDQTEAMTMGSRIAILRDGVLQQADSPQTIYDKPLNAFVARFIGSPPMNVWRTNVAAKNGKAWATFGEQALLLPESVKARLTIDSETPRSYLFGLRPEDVFAAESQTDDDPETARAGIESAERIGRESFAYLRLPGLEETITLASREATRFEADSGLRIGFRWNRLHVFDVESENRLFDGA